MYQVVQTFRSAFPAGLKSCTTPAHNAAQILQRFVKFTTKIRLITSARFLQSAPSGMRDLVLELPPRPGELARIASALARQQVAIRGGTLMALGPRLIARFIPSDLDAARRALENADVPFEESEVMPVLLESRAGELAMLSTRLASGGVSVRAIYITGTNGNILEVAIAPPDNSSFHTRPAVCASFANLGLP